MTLPAGIEIPEGFTLEKMPGRETVYWIVDAAGRRMIQTFSCGQRRASALEITRAIRWCADKMRTPEWRARYDEDTARFRAEVMPT